MAEAADIALSNEWQNCGAYTDVHRLWVQPLYLLFHRSNPTDYTGPQQLLFPHKLLDALARCRVAGLIPLIGDPASTDLDNWEHALVDPATEYVGYLTMLLEDSQRLCTLPGINIPGIETQDEEAPVPAHSPNPPSTPRPATPTLQRLSDQLSQPQQDPVGITSLMTDESASNMLATPLPVIGYRGFIAGADTDRTAITSSTSPEISLVATATALDVPDRCSNNVLAPSPAPPPVPDPVAASTATIVPEGMTDSHLHLTQSSAALNPAPDDIELQTLSASQTFQSQSQSRVVSGGEQRNPTNTLATIFIPSPSGDLPSQGSLVCYILGFTISDPFTNIRYIIRLHTTPKSMASLTASHHPPLHIYQPLRQTSLLQNKHHLHLSKLYHRPDLTTTQIARRIYGSPLS